MPGIAGIIRPTAGKPEASQVQTMVKTMKHEAFYSSGTLQVEGQGVSVGWTALQGSFADAMPIWNETKDVVFFFAGEHFPGPDQIEELRRRGYSTGEHSARCLVHLYEAYGPGFFEKLDGCFSGLVIDLRRGEVTLFNDRYGLGRLYVHETADGFYFASEAKALLRILPGLRSLDMQAVAERFSCGCTLQGRTLFTGLSLLPGGACWKFRAGQIQSRDLYFRRDAWESLPEMEPEEYTAAVESTFARVLRKYFVGKGPIGVSLTGGLDSRMIMAWQPLPPYMLECYTYGGMIRECQDVLLARRVAQTCQQNHRVIGLNTTLFKEFPALAKRSVYYSDGCMDVTGAVGIFNNRLAREVSTIRLTGNYGDEVIRGVVSFKPTAHALRGFEAGLTSQIQAAQAVYDAELKCRRPTFIAFKQVPWYHYCRLSMEQTQISMRTPYLDQELVALTYRAPASLAANKKLACHLIGRGNPALVRFPTDRGPLGRGGLFGRLREEYQEFTFKAEYAYDYGMPQWLVKADHRFRRWHLERLFLGRHKYAHFRLWYREDLAKYVKDVLLDPRTLDRPYLDRKRVEHMVAAHTGGTGNHTLEISALLTLEIIQRQLITMK